MGAGNGLHERCGSNMECHGRFLWTTKRSSVPPAKAGQDRRSCRRRSWSTTARSTSPNTSPVRAQTPSTGRRSPGHPTLPAAQDSDNVKDRLPQRLRSTVGRRMTDAYHADAALPSRAGPRGRRARSSRGCARAQTAVIPDLLTRPLLHFNQKKDTKVQMHRPENCWRMASNVCTCRPDHRTPALSSL